jgi:AraC family transcriptional regulator
MAGARQPSNFLAVSERAFTGRERQFSVSLRSYLFLVMAFSNLSPHLDFTSDRDMQKILPAEAIVSSERTTWDALHLKYYRYNAHEIPTNASQQHVIIVQTDITELGHQEMTLDGITKREVLQEGQVLIIPAQTANSANWETPHGSIILGIDTQLFQQQAIAAEQFHAQLKPHFAQVDPLLHGMALALRQELSLGQPGGKIYVQSATTMLVQHLLRNYSESQEASSSSSPGLPAYHLKYVVEYMREHLVEDLDLAQLAQLIKLSQSHFTSLFRKSTGQSPYQYLLRLRVERAKELLAIGDLSIADVAISVGFYDQSHLTKQMKRLLGFTPRQFRKGL